MVYQSEICDVRGLKIWNAFNFMTNRKADAVPYIVIKEQGNLKPALHNTKLKNIYSGRKCKWIVMIKYMNNKKNIKHCSENQIKINIVRKELDSSCKPRKSEIKFGQLPDFW